MTQFTAVRLTEHLNNKLLIARVQLGLKTKEDVIAYAIEHLEKQGVIKTGI